MCKASVLLSVGEVETLVGAGSAVGGLGGTDAGLDAVPAGGRLDEAAARSYHVRLVDRRGHHRGRVGRGLKTKVPKIDENVLETQGLQTLTRSGFINASSDTSMAAALAGGERSTMLASLGGGVRSPPENGRAREELREWLLPVSSSVKSEFRHQNQFESGEIVLTHHLKSSRQTEAGGGSCVAGEKGSPARGSRCGGRRP